MIEPTLNDPQPAPSVTPPKAGEDTGAAQEVVAPAPGSQPPLLLKLLVGVALLGAIAVGYWWFNRDSSIPTTVLGDQPTVADLQGLDQPQMIAGECVESFTVHGIGTDATKQQRYALSVQLVANPADDGELATLMASDACASELKLIGESITERLGFMAAQQELFTTSYVTQSGARLFLP